MTDMDVPERSLDDEQIAESAPRVRYLMLQRLELIWKQVEDHLDPEKGTDPRWAEIGVRTLDRLGRLYRLDKPKAAPDEEDDLSAGVDRGQLVLLQLEKYAKDLAKEGQGVGEGGITKSTVRPPES
jgi:hypothetical protein